MASLPSSLGRPWTLHPRLCFSHDIHRILSIASSSTKMPFAATTDRPHDGPPGHPPTHPPGFPPWPGNPGYHDPTTPWAPDNPFRWFFYAWLGFILFAIIISLSRKQNMSGHSGSDDANQATWRTSIPTETTTLLNNEPPPPYTDPGHHHGGHAHHPPAHDPAPPAHDPTPAPAPPDLGSTGHH